MSVIIGVPKEVASGERRIAIVPEIAKKFQSLGADVCIERGAGNTSYLRDEAFEEVQFQDNAVGIFSKSNLILKVQAPTLDEIRAMQPGTIVIGFMQPYQDRDRALLLCEKNITSFAVELIPRISRAQSMDALSSQAAVAGYQCVLMAAILCPKFFPMMTYAAGTLRPARVLIIGAGVAGLQAIATARRLGALVEAYDVRPETKEQVESLGAKFVDTGVLAAGAGGYARELTEDEKNRQQEKLAKAIAQVDVVITTAAIPGKRSPLIVTQSMIAGMKPGAVIIDMAAEGGGNCAGTSAGERVVINDVSLVGATHLASRMPLHASEMYAKNLFNFCSPFIKEGVLTLDWDDEILTGSVFTHAGQIRHEGVKKTLEVAA